MADDADSKSVVGNHVRVQVPLPAFAILLRSAKSKESQKFINFWDFFILYPIPRCSKLGYTTKHTVPTASDANMQNTAPSASPCNAAPIANAITITRMMKKRIIICSIDFTTSIAFDGRIACIRSPKHENMKSIATSVTNQRSAINRFPRRITVAITIPGSRSSTQSTLPARIAYSTFLYGSSGTRKSQLCEDSISIGFPKLRKNKLAIY